MPMALLSISRLEDASVLDSPTSRMSHGFKANCSKSQADVSEIEF